MSNSYGVGSAISENAVQLGGGDAVGPTKGA